MSYDVVNGYLCRNCTDVDYAKRNIDPQHPKDGPFGINRDPRAGPKADHGPAVVLGGALGKPTAAPAATPVASVSDGPSGVSQVAAANPADRNAAPRPAGRRIDISV
jgi:hypothetical protein